MQEYISNLDYSIIQKSSEKFTNIKEAIISLEIEEQQVPFKVEMYKVFSPVSIKECVVELVGKINSAKIYDKDGFGDIMMPYTMFLCIKHFTTLKLPEVFSEQVLAIKDMLNTGALMQIYLNFEEDQLELIRLEIENVLENFDNNMDFMKQFKDEYAILVKDKKLLDF